MRQPEINVNSFIYPTTELRGYGCNDRLYIVGNDSAENFNESSTITGIEQIYAILNSSRLDVTENRWVQRAGIQGGSVGSNTVNLYSWQNGVVEGIAGAVATFSFKDDDGGDRGRIRLENATLSEGLNVENVAQVTLEAVGRSNINTLTADGVDSLKIDGNGVVRMDLADHSSITTVRAVGGGGFDLDTTTAPAADLTVIGGNQDDRVVITLADLNENDHISLGRGSNTLATAGDLNLNDAATVAGLRGVSGVEWLETDGGVLTVDDRALSGYSHYAAANGGSLQITGGMDGMWVEFRDGRAESDSSISMVSAHSRLNLSLAAGWERADAGSVTVNTDQLFIRSVGSSTAVTENNAIDLKAPEGTEIVLTGTHGLTMVLDNNGGDEGFTVDAFDFNSFLDITGSAGADTFGVLEHHDNGAAQFVADLHDFITGVDKLAGGVTGTAMNFVVGSTADDYDAFLELASETFAENHDAVYFTAVVDGDLYLAQDVGHDGQVDAVVKFDGVSSIHYTDII